MEEFAFEKKTLVHDNLGSSSTNSFVCFNCCSQVNRKSSRLIIYLFMLITGMKYLNQKVVVVMRIAKL